MRLRHGTLRLLGLLGLVALSPVPVQAQVTAAPSLMNFQGRLTKPDSTPVTDGTYSVRFSLWDAITAGTETWNQTIGSVAVKNGTFAVQLSGFPTNTFNSDQWLEIKIGTDAPLTPRQPLVSVPYALKANTVPDGSIGAAQIANGSLTADKFASGALNNLSWLLGGNSGTNPASQFLGTTDNQPLVFRTNNIEKMRLLADGKLGIGTNTPGSKLDVAGTDTIGIRYLRTDARDARIQVGDNTKTWSLATGWAVAGDLSIIEEGAAGDRFYIQKITGNVGIGTSTPAAMLHVKGGLSNVGVFAGDLAPFGTASFQTNISAPATHAWFAENGNRVFSVTAGGTGYFGGTVEMTGFKLPTGAGTNKVLTSDASGVGTWNVLSITNSMIQSVDWSKITSIPGGLGGFNNNANSLYCTVAGGWSNSASQLRSATIAGGESNTASGYATSVVGGVNNTASGYSSTVAGGVLNTASGDHSFAAGRRAKAIHNGSFVWADQGAVVTGTDFASTGNNQFLIRATGGIGLGPSTFLDFGFGVAGRDGSAGKVGYQTFSDALDIVGAGTTGTNRKVKIWAEGGTTFTGGATFIGNINVNGITYTSDARYKTHIATFDNALDTILNLHGVTFDWDREVWKDRGFAAGKQIGFIAQEVEKILPELVNTDADGYKSVAYANVVPVLVEAVKTLKTENDATKKENAELKSRLEALELAVQRLTAQPR